MDISRNEQRVLHAQAQGGLIRYRHEERGRIVNVPCFTRESHVLLDCALAVFPRLRCRRLNLSALPHFVSRTALLRA